eukprot:CAMPEP_0184499390 /NCGR_PEP_ID=MMETSP0113_2-20130426/41373_1 /TAXON_ID=91329 /ORGANISM="Norrisiella sphaerica, Strain BC52" /LENGTH=1497 /DNA_ID=CAMNT_0026887281 /DNA_START=73 /DNA_END=4566 /DNA_ORIENTATION=-
MDLKHTNGDHPAEEDRKSHTSDATKDSNPKFDHPPVPTPTCSDEKLKSQKAREVKDEKETAGSPQRKGSSGANAQSPKIDMEVKDRGTSPCCPRVIQNDSTLISTKVPKSRRRMKSRRNSLYIDVKPEDVILEEKIIGSTRFTAAAPTRFTGPLRYARERKGEDERRVIIALEVLNRHQIRCLSVLTWGLFFFSSVFSFFEVSTLQDTHEFSMVQPSSSSVNLYFLDPEPPPLSPQGLYLQDGVYSASFSYFSSASASHASSSLLSSSILTNLHSKMKYVFPMSLLSTFSVIPFSWLLESSVVSSSPSSLFASSYPSSNLNAHPHSAQSSVLLQSFSSGSFWSSQKIGINRLNFLMAMESTAKSLGFQNVNNITEGQVSIGVCVSVFKKSEEIWTRTKNITEQTFDILNPDYKFYIFDAYDDAFGERWQLDLLGAIDRNSELGDSDLYMFIDIQYGTNTGLSGDGDFTVQGIDRSYLLRYNNYEYRIFDMVLRNSLILITILAIIFWFSNVLAFKHEWISEQYWISILLSLLVLLQDPFLTPMYLTSNDKWLQYASALAFIIPDVYTRLFWLLMSDAVRIQNHGQYVQTKQTDREMMQETETTSKRGESGVLEMFPNIQRMVGRMPEWIRRRLVKIHGYAVSTPDATHSFDFYVWKLVLALLALMCEIAVVFITIDQDLRLSSHDMASWVFFAEQGTLLAVFGSIGLAVFILWVIWLIYSLYKSNQHLAKLPYLQTRFRQLSFRDFSNKTFLVITYFIIVAISTAFVPENSNLVDYRTRVGTSTLILISGYIYILALSYLPVSPRVVEKKRQSSFYGKKQFLREMMTDEPSGFRLEWARWIADLAWMAYMDPPGTENSGWGIINVAQFGFKLIHFETGEALRTGTRWYMARHEKSDTIVISFRGSVSKMDLRTNVNFQMTVVPPEFFEMRELHDSGEEGDTKTCQERVQHDDDDRLQMFIQKFNMLLEKAKPAGRVHSGFYSAWISVREEVFRAVQAEIKDMKTEPLVICTGHSLGGALATFCAYELRAKCHLNVHMYNYGSPRVGNPEFRKAYNSMVPNSFRLIYDRDVVPTVPDSLFFCCCLYRHVGREVIVDGYGNIVCDPSHVERSIRAKRGVSINDHLLSNYEEGLNLACVQYGFGYRRLFWKQGAARAQSHSESETLLSTSERKKSSQASGAMVPQTSSKETDRTKVDLKTDALDAETTGGIRTSVGAGDTKFGNHGKDHLPGDGLHATVSSAIDESPAVVDATGNHVSPCATKVLENDSHHNNTISPDTPKKVVAGTDTSSRYKRQRLSDPTTLTDYKTKGPERLLMVPIQGLDSHKRKAWTDDRLARKIERTNQKRTKSHDSLQTLHLGGKSFKTPGQVGTGEDANSLYTHLMPVLANPTTFFAHPRHHMTWNREEMPRRASEGQRSLGGGNDERKKNHEPGQRRQARNSISITATVKKRKPANSSRARFTRGRLWSTRSNYLHSVAKKPSQKDASEAIDKASPSPKQE